MIFTDARVDISDLSTVDKATATPDEIRGNFSESFISTTNELHLKLEQEAKRVLCWHTENAPETYFDTHRTMGRKMTQARYPNINDEITAVYLIVNGLEGHSHLGDAEDKMFTVKRKHMVADLHERLEWKPLKVLLENRDDMPGINSPE